MYLGRYCVVNESHVARLFLERTLRAWNWYWLSSRPQSKRQHLVTQVSLEHTMMPVLTDIELPDWDNKIECLHDIQHVPLKSQRRIPLLKVEEVCRISRRLGPRFGPGALSVVVSELCSDRLPRLAVYVVVQHLFIWMYSGIVTSEAWSRSQQRQSFPLPCAPFNN